MPEAMVDQVLEAIRWTSSWPTTWAYTVIHVPDGYELVTLIPLGYPATVGSAPNHRESHEFTHEKYF